MARWSLVFILTLLILPGCHSDHLHGTEHFVTKGMQRSENKVMVPTSLWEKMEALNEKQEETALKTGHGEENVQHEDTVDKLESRVQMRTRFMPIRAYLIEKTKGILGGENYELVFSDGGGELDLADYLEPKRGDFYFIVKSDPDSVKENPVKVYFLSRGKRRKIDNIEYGAGCSSYLDISTFFDKTFSKKGIEATTIEAKHATVLSGTYFFASSVKGVLNLAQITVKDSRHDNLICTPRK